MSTKAQSCLVSLLLLGAVSCEKSQLDTNDPDVIALRTPPEIEPEESSALDEPELAQDTELPIQGDEDEDEDVVLEDDDLEGGSS